MQGMAYRSSSRCIQQSPTKQTLVINSVLTCAAAVIRAKSIILIRPIQAGQVLQQQY
jgi:hypothetical protein